MFSLEPLPLEAKHNEASNYVTSAFFGAVDLSIPEYDWSPVKQEETQPRVKPMGKNSKTLQKKRKSLEISESKEIREIPVLEPLPFKQLRSIDENDFDTALFSHLMLDEDPHSFPQNSVHIPSLESTSFGLNSNKLLFSRRSEDWDAKPLETRPKFVDETQKKRFKWSAHELNVLWTSIASHGNNWSLINDILTSRSYYQIKDKGRRVLYEHGWTTGRNKRESEIANRQAKEIAQKYLAKRK